MSENKFSFQIFCAMKVRAAAHDPEFHIRKHLYYMLEYVVGGAGFVEYAGEKYYCPATSVYFFQPGRDYRYYQDPDDPWSKIYVIFDGEFAESMIKSYDLQDKLFFPAQEKCFPYFCDLLNLKFNSHETASLLIHHIFNQLSQVEKNEENIPSVVYVLKTELEGAVNKKFLLKDFAEKWDISTTGLIEKFKNIYKCTPYEYLLRCRLNSAGNMLKYTHLSIKEIASVLNFNDQYYFSNLFKQRHGVSPKKFREDFWK